MDKHTYILDTNVLMHDPRAIFTFAHSIVGIPAAVLEELDQFKKDSTSCGRNTREAIRVLDGLRSKGSLHNGITLDNGATIQVFFPPRESTDSIIFARNIEDNKILMVAADLKAKRHNVIFVSKDLNARIKADALGIPAEDYQKEEVSPDDFYHGWTRIQVPAVQLTKDVPLELQALAEQHALILNQCIIVESNHNLHNYRVYRYLGGSRFKLLTAPTLPWPLAPRNPQQLMALDLLLDDSIQLVSLFGPAGTGKTFLALLAGIHQVTVVHRYERLLISRPVVPLGRDIGYLPGTMEEKLRSWMLPIYDNIHFITHAARRRPEGGPAGDHQDGGTPYKKGRKTVNKPDRPEGPSHLSLEELMRTDRLSLEAITYMRGRSIPFQWILIDEVQNLTPHEVKTIISRVGEGSKMILTGDPYQIDSPYLDFASNGLVVASERFKDQKIFGTIFMEKSERSSIAQLANKLL